MLANQASFTPPTTAASSDQVMQDKAGRLWTSLGQAPGLPMAWRRLRAFRSDLERRSAVVSLIVVLPVRRANEFPNCLCWQPSSSMSIGFCETERIGGNTDHDGGDRENES